MQHRFLRFGLVHWCDLVLLFGQYIIFPPYMEVWKGRQGWKCEMSLATSWCKLCLLFICVVKSRECVKEETLHHVITIYFWHSDKISRLNRMPLVYCFCFCFTSPGGQSYMHSILFSTYPYLFCFLIEILVLWQFGN